jgi:hypothetical protein
MSTELTQGTWIAQFLRLVAVLTDLSIRDTLLFPLVRPGRS